MQGVEADFGDFADRWWKIIGTNLDLLCHWFGDGVDDVFVRLENVTHRILQAVLTLMGDETKQRRRHGYGDELAERCRVQDAITAQ
jgi:hypothetical protein